MADIDFDVDALEDMAYRDIQALCKRIGIRANQKKAVLVDLLRDYHTAHTDEGETKEEEEENNGEHNEQEQPEEEEEKGKESEEHEEHEEEVKVVEEEVKPKRVARRRNRQPSTVVQEAQEEVAVEEQAAPEQDEAVPQVCDNSFANMPHGDISGEVVYEAEEDDSREEAESVEEASMDSAVSLGLEEDACQEDDVSVGEEELEEETAVTIDIPNSKGYATAQDEEGHEEEEMEYVDDEADDEEGPFDDGANADSMDEEQEGPAEGHDEANEQDGLREPAMDNDDDEDQDERPAEELLESVDEMMLEDEANHNAQQQEEGEKEQEPATETAVVAVKTPASPVVSAPARSQVRVAGSLSAQAPNGKRVAKRRMSMAAQLSVARPTISSMRRSMAAAAEMTAKKRPAPASAAPPVSSTALMPSSRRASLAPSALFATKAAPAAAGAPSRRMSLAPSLTKVGHAASTPVRPTTAATGPARPSASLSVAVAPRQATPMPGAKRPANGPAASARALARTSSAVAEKPKRVDFEAVHSREFSKKEGITDYVSRMKNKLGQSKHQASPAAPAAPAVTTSSGGLGIPARLLQKKRKDREDSEKENDVTANGTVTRAGDLQPTLKRARASISHHVARGGTVSQPTTPATVRTTGSHRLVAGQEAAIDSRKRRMSYTPHRGPVPAYPQQSAAPLSAPVSAEALSTAISAAVAVAVASPARALVSPMRPVGTRVLHRSRTADLLDEEATLLEVHAPATTPIKRRRLELPEAGAEQDNNTTTVIAEAAAVINEAHALDTMTPLEVGEEDQTTARPTKREGWRSVERKNGPRPEGRSQNRRHTVANRRILALIAEESQ